MNITHGHKSGGSASPTYRSWSWMRSRCMNPNATDYAHYGGRGISVCARWDSFEHFLADMGERPEDLTLDRIDVNGDYEPDNCRWATQSEQQHNKRPRSRATHCKRGHLLDEENTYAYPQYRQCKACFRIRREAAKRKS